MTKGHIFSQAYSCGEFLKQPIVEIAGQNRLLIENHQGVLEYSQEKIGVKVSYGKIIVVGNELKLKQMSCDQLVIKGQVESLQLLGR